MSAWLRRGLGWVRDVVVPHRPTWRSASVLGLVVALVVAAFLVDGYRSAKFELDEGSVWATSAERGVAGRINTLAGQVEVGSAKKIGSGVDVEQRGREVLLVDPGKAVTPIDAAMGNPAGDSIELRDDMVVTSGGGKVAVLSSKQSRLWVSPFASLGEVDLDRRKGSVPVAADATVVIGPAGSVFAVSVADGSIRHLGGPRGGESTIPLQLDPAGGPLEATVVGTTPVVLATATGRLQIGTRSVDLARHGAHPRLQEGPGSGDVVLVATDTELVSVPLADGTPEVLHAEGSGGAVRPVRVGRCAYAAWKGDPATAGSTAQLARSCGATALAKPLPPDRFPAGSEARFRVNGTYVVLNRLDDGTSLLLRESSLVVIDNWADLVDEVPTDQIDPNDTADGGDDECDPAADNTTPKAKLDELGARSGVATVLDVLRNDTDGECDVLAIVGTPTDLSPPDAGTLITVDRGHALQFTSRADFIGTVTFSYQVSDGRSAAETADVTVTVKPIGSGNEPPVQVREAKISVGPTQTVSFNVLDSFVDPDGDAVFLDAASLPPGTTGTVRAESNGTVTFVDSGSEGKFEIELRVSDGVEGATGSLGVQMVGDPSPIARNDHALALVDQPVSIDVLANDTGLPGQELALIAAESPDAGTSVEKDAIAGLVVFSASAPGTYRVSYTINSGPKEATAFIRIDVSAPTENRPPVAVRDTATVVVGGSTTVDLVANDADPDLDVLVVSAISVPPGTGLTVQLVEHRALRISASRLPEVQPVVITYQVSDGQADPVEGQLQLQVVTTGRVNQPPTARDDLAVVRVGDVVTVPVLANDIDPDGDTLKVGEQVSLNVADGEPEPGLAFATENAVRFVAGNEPRAVTISYEASDGVTAPASALVRLRIVPRDGKQPPVPRSVEARTLVDAPVRVNINTFGIDPDGDAVQLTLERPPTLGTAVAVKDCDCFDYTPSKGKSGTDVFTYRATDPDGLSGIATIRVGIGVRTRANQPPTPIADQVEVRPGSRRAVPVLANDTDPDLDQIELVDDPIRAPEGMTAEVVGDRVVVQAASPMVATLTYQVTDGKEASPGSLTVEVSDQAPLVPPIARDDVATVPRDRTDEVPVPVLDNDEDADGAKADLRVEVAPMAASIARFDEESRQVVVRLGTLAAVVPYRITDVDGQTATAVIRVPPASVNLPPRLKANLPVRTVGGGTTETIELGDVVEDPEGAGVLLVPGDSIRGDHGTAVATGPTTLSFTADDGYSGPGAVAFTVTDGSDPTDPRGARAVLVLPLEIRSTTNTPPTLTGASATVEVDGEPTVVDLRTYAEDGDEGDLETLRFEGLSGMANGVEATLEGSKLTVTATKEAQKNTSLVLSLTVADAENPPVAASVEVSVVASRKPLATVRDFEVLAATEVAKEVAVLEGAQAPDGLAPLVVESAYVDPALGDVAVSGGTVRYTPKAEHLGFAEVKFTVNDAIGDPDRRVTGTIRVTVKDRPGKPQPPVATDSGHEFVVLRWEPADARGGTIDRYEISTTDGSIPPKVCTGAATTCRLTAADGIENDHGEGYRFTVRAHNEVEEKNGGWSEASDPSPLVRPDTRPNASTVGPTLTYRPSLRSGELEITWPAAQKTGPWVNLGSPILEYEVQLQPQPPNTAQLKVGPTTTSLIVTGLTDGKDYTAKVRARNSAGKEVDPDQGWSDFSPVSNTESPASKPSAPTAVDAKRRDDPVTSVIEVTWSKPAAINASQLLSYTILMSRNGVESRVPAVQPASSASFKQDIAADIGATYTFRVVASNKAGESPPSSATPPATGFTKPRRITSVTAAATGNNGEVRLTFTPPSAEGDPIDTYRVVITPGGADFKAYGSGGVTVTGLSNFTSYTFTVAACNQGTNVAYCGDPSPPTASTNPYGPPGAPSVGANHIGGNTIRLNWSAPAANGRPIDRIEISVDGGGWQSRSDLNGSVDVNTGYSQTHCIVARAVSSGLTGPQSSQACARAPDPPPPPRAISLTRGANAPAGSWYSVTLSGFNQGERVTLQCHDSVDQNFWTETVTINAGGTYSDSTLCYSADGPDHWVTGGGEESNHVGW